MAVTALFVKWRKAGFLRGIIIMQVQIDIVVRGIFDVKY